MSSSGKIVNLVNPTIAQDAATKSYVDTSIPVGGIIMWNGAGVTLPSNWKLCDGSTYNGITTPDLRGRFVLSSTTPTSANGNIALAGGLSTRNVNATGGVETVQLAETHMPSHSHSVSARTGNASGQATDGDHGHPVSIWSNPWSNVDPDGVFVPGNPQAYHTAYQWNGKAQVQRVADNRPQAYHATDNRHATWHNHTITVSETAKGGDTAHENMPPFYVLAFIMRIS